MAQQIIKKSLKLKRSLFGYMSFKWDLEKKNNNTIFFFYLRYLNKNLIVLRGLSYLWLLMRYICEYLAKNSNTWVKVFS